VNNSLLVGKFSPGPEEKDQKRGTGKPRVAAFDFVSYFASLSLDYLID
jgi:hypothetical protein